MNKIILFVLVLACLSASVSIVSAEERKWQPVMSGWFSFGNTSSVIDNPEEHSERKIKPAPQPTLDLPVERGVFSIITLIISSVIILYSRKFMKHLSYF